MSHKSCIMGKNRAQCMIFYTFCGKYFTKWCMRFLAKFMQPVTNCNGLLSQISNKFETNLYAKYNSPKLILKKTFG